MCFCQKDSKFESHKTKKNGHSLHGFSYTLQDAYFVIQKISEMQIK